MLYPIREVDPSSDECQLLTSARDGALVSMDQCDVDDLNCEVAESRLLGWRRRSSDGRERRGDRERLAIRAF